MTLSRRRPRPEPPRGEGGFTLIELMISLALFGLIAVAGVALVDGTLNTGARTDGRLERLAEVQRAAFLLVSDLDQVAQGDILGAGDTLSFRRHGLGIGGVAGAVEYRLVGGVFTRSISGIPRAAATQPLLEGVSSARWRFYTAEAGWIDRWPPSPDGPPLWPAAIAVELGLAPGEGAQGTLRRVVALPARP